MQKSVCCDWVDLFDIPRRSKKFCSFERNTADTGLCLSFKYFITSDKLSLETSKTNTKYYVLAT